MTKKLIGNLENVEPKQYVFNKAGQKKAVLVHRLGRNDCPRCWEKLNDHYTDGNKVYKKLKIEINN